MSHTVRALPSGRLTTVQPGETLLTAIRRIGLPIGSSCDGDGICGKCGVEICDGADAIEPEGDEERQIKEAQRVPTAERLACRARVRGDVSVRARYW